MIISQGINPDRYPYRSPDDALLLRSGNLFWPSDIRPHDIDHDDFLTGICREERFSMQAISFYSVAEHSLILSQLVQPKYKKWALLHDFSEGILGDVASPIKKLLPDYKKLEKNLMDEVIRMYNLTPDEPDEVKYFDKLMGPAEMLVLFPDTGEFHLRSHDNRAWTKEEWNLMRSIAKKVKCMKPEEVKEEWQKEFDIVESLEKITWPSVQ